MSTAFLSASFTSSTLSSRSFIGTAPNVRRRVCNTGIISMAAYSLDKYTWMSEDSVTAPLSGPSRPSSGWTSFLDTLKLANAPYPADTHAATADSAKGLPATPYTRFLMTIKAESFGKGGDPDHDITKYPGPRAADRYMAQCIVKQCKAMATPTGVYTVHCTEGTVRGQAEEARNASLSTTFRLSQRSSAQKFGDFYEMRRQATIASHGCTYEEGLLGRFPISARAYVTAGSEARLNCVRYSDGTSDAEKYMASCVDKQMKFRAVPNGLYDVLCSDGTSKGVAEYKRVSSISAKFRSKQMSSLAKEQAKFDNAAYARAHFGHGCSYEEHLFNSYPAVSASMRPSTARY